ncbi:MAG: efflux RND transporter periplasmic adaptor subunit [Bacteroidales bacterium]|nr:efflux RND transporter periplasmic adaptor subunit [Candidatus Physcousia equi]
MKTKFLSVVTALAAVTIVMSSCGKKQQMTMPAANFETMLVQTRDLVIDSKFSATIRGRQDIDVLPQVSGTLQKLCVTEGQKVTKGQTLFVIDQVPYQAALNTAEAALNAAKAGLATAQLNYDSKKELFDQHIVSDFDVQQAMNQLQTVKAQVAQAQAQVVNARNSLSYTVVKSPANGVVGTLPYRQGALVSPSMPKPLTTVSDNTQMYVYFSINESQLLSIARDHNGSLEAAIAAMPKVKLQLVDGSAYDQEGTIESVSGVVDRATGTVQLRAVFDNPMKLLHSGSTGTVLMPLTYNDVVTIPSSAAVQSQTKYIVYTVDKENVAHSRVVDVSTQHAGDDFIVLDGLEKGEKIVAKGAAMVKNGQNIKPNTEETEK